MATDFLHTWELDGLTEYNRKMECHKFGEFLVTLADDIGLTLAQSCISIGVGDGEVDITLLNNSFPRIKKYTALEPSAIQVALCQKQFGALGRNDVSIQFVNSRMEDWEGPEEPVDVVMMIHSIYNMEDRLQNMKRCLKWLKPGGTVCVVTDGDGSLFYSIAQKYGGTNQLYRSKDVRSDLEKLGLEYREAKWTNAFDIRNRGPDLMDFLAQKKLTQDEFDDLEKYLQETVPTGITISESHIIWSKLPATEFN